MNNNQTLPWLSVHPPNERGGLGRLEGDWPQSRGISFKKMMPFYVLSDRWEEERKNTKGSKRTEAFLLFPSLSVVVLTWFLDVGVGASTHKQSNLTCKSNNINVSGLLLINVWFGPPVQDGLMPTYCTGMFQSRGLIIEDSYIVNLSLPMTHIGHTSRRKRRKKKIYWQLISIK